MKTFKLIQLASMLPIIFAGCAPQLSQQLASVTYDPDTTDLTDETYIENGFDIPGLNLGKGDGACNVAIRLQGLYYYGDDIGNEWYLNVSVNGRTWNSGKQLMHHDEFHWIDEQIYYNLGATGCYPINLLFFNVTAREEDPLFDDIGRASDACMIRCMPKITGKWLLMPVLVVERPDGIDAYKVARLEFIFYITSECM